MQKGLIGLIIIWDILVLIAAGLLYLTYSKRENWKNERTELHSWPIITIFWICSLTFVIITSFFHSSALRQTIPSYIVPIVGSSVLIGGVLYWVAWAKVWPLLGIKTKRKSRERIGESEGTKLRYVTLQCICMCKLLTLYSTWAPWRSAEQSSVKYVQVRSEEEESEGE